MADEREEIRRKASGDQHLVPIDEPAEDPHRPHRLNRGDNEKTLPDGDAIDYVQRRRLAGWARDQLGIGAATLYRRLKSYGLIGGRRARRKRR